MYWIRLATFRNAPKTRNTPTRNSNSGSIASFCSGLPPSPSARNELMIITAVALVGPRTIKRDPENNGARIAATADPKMPYLMGNPAIAAYAIPWGNASKATFRPAFRSSWNRVASYPRSDLVIGRNRIKPLSRAAAGVADDDGAGDIWLSRAPTMNVIASFDNAKRRPAQGHRLAADHPPLLRVLEVIS